MHVYITIVHLLHPSVCVLFLFTIGSYRAKKFYLSGHLKQMNHSKPVTHNLNRKISGCVRKQNASLLLTEQTIVHCTKIVCEQNEIRHK